MQRTTQTTNRKNCNNTGCKTEAKLSMNGQDVCFAHWLEAIGASAAELAAEQRHDAQRNRTEKAALHVVLLGLRELGVIQAEIVPSADQPGQAR